MGNKYFSVVRNFIARNVAEDTISPPNDLVIVGNSTEWVEQIAGHFSQWVGDEQSNIILKQCSVFSNFADGLVFKNANESIDLDITAYGVSTWSSIGNVSLTRGSKTMTGAGFVANLSANDILRITNGNNYYYALVDSVTDDNNAELKDYAQITLANVAGFNATGAVPSDVYRFRNIRALNTFYNSEYFFTPATFDDPALLDIIITVQPNADLSGEVHDDVSFLTKSISTDFDQDAVYFDSILKLEITSRYS